MSTAAVSGFGSVLKKGATAIAEIKSISGPSLSRNTIDATNMDSANGWKEFIGGLKDAGEVSIECNFLPTNATQKAAYTDLGDGSVDAYSIVWSDSGGTTWTFNAICVGFDPKAELDGALSATMKFKLTGAPTLP